VTDFVQQERAYLDLVYPTPQDTPGCASLFDAFLSCNGKSSTLSSQPTNHQSPSLLVLFNQYKSLYRYGHMAHCADKFQDWRFCLNQRMLDPDQRREVWLQRRALWWAKRRLDKSSEDVWEIRTWANSCFFSRLSFDGALNFSQPLQRFPSPLSPEDLARVTNGTIF
jgi:hypothetical protein